MISNTRKRWSNIVVIAGVLVCCPGSCITDPGGSEPNEKGIIIFLSGGAIIILGCCLRLDNSGAPGAADSTDEVSRKFGLVTTGTEFVFKGGYYDKIQSSLSTPEACVSQVRTLKSTGEICVTISDPVLIIIPAERGPLAFRTSLPASRAAEFVELLNPAERKISTDGKVCLATLRT
jgi:hypothetical protein